MPSSTPSGPMRYGCDPVSLELLDLWRQCDDETVFTMTGRSILDRVHQEPEAHPEDVGAD